MLSKLYRHAGIPLLWPVLPIVIMQLIPILYEKRPPVTEVFFIAEHSAAYLMISFRNASKQSMLFFFSAVLKATLRSTFLSCRFTMKSQKILSYRL